MPHPRPLTGPLRLEPRDVPAGGLVAASAGSEVVLYDLETGTVRAAFAPFGPDFTGGSSVALADVTGDGVPEVIVGAGAGGGPRVRVFDLGTLDPIRDFFAFDPAFRGGVSVAAGDATGDGVADILAGAGPGGGPHVAAFDGRTGNEVLSFFAFDPAFTGGVTVAATDLTGDGIDEAITGAGAGGGPRVRAFDPTTGKPVLDLFAFDASFRGGVNVAGADPDRRGRGRVIASPGPGGGPEVREFDPAGNPLRSFLAGDPAGRDGTAVGAFVLGDGWWIVAGTAGATAVFDGADGRTIETLGSPAGATAAAVAGTRLLLGPVLHAADPAGVSFADPTVVPSRLDRIAVGNRSYIAPFAVLDATAGPIAIGTGSNLQDNVELAAGPGGITVGDRTILAHNATVLGGARVGAAGGSPAFVGFNAVIDNATVEADGYVSALARIGPGVVVRSGTKVLPGKFVRTQAEADDPALGKVTAVTAADREFMVAVLHVNEAFAAGYPQLVAEFGIVVVSGFGPNPGGSDFNPDRSTPTLHGAPAVGPAESRYRNRVVGAVHLEDTLDELSAASGNRSSIRADEGHPFDLGRIAGLRDRTTFHALEHTEIVAGNNVRYGSHAVVHGGEDSGNSPPEVTRIGDGVTISDWAVVFRSTVGAGSTIGFRAYVDGSQIAPGTAVPDRAIIVKNEFLGFVEW